MKLIPKILTFLTYLVTVLLVIDCSKTPTQIIPQISNKDPFSALGIPDLTPKQLFKELEENMTLIKCKKNYQ